MTEQELRDLITEGETLTVEFKSDRRDGLSDADLQEAVVCLANHEGGHLLVGVEDNGRITRLHPKHLASTPSALASALRNFLLGSMPPDIRCQFVPTDGGTVAVIHVRRAKAPVSTSKTVTLRRGIGPDNKLQCLPIGPDELVSLRATRGLYDHSARPLPELGFDALSRAELDRIRSFIRTRPQATKSLAELGDQDLAVSLKLVVRQEGQLVPTILGLLLAGTAEILEERIPVHSVALQDLDAGRNVTANDFYREPLLRIWELFKGFFMARNTEREVSLGLNLQRTAIARYPRRAVREAFANALIHRDYTLWPKQLRTKLPNF
ncbi:helix-turn-helix domain-containing protein [Deinococcus oregonensis]|uniref:Helix-turn-helix domain-containing protein n=1 Tax=Deinococcus oregonensis TaxID=1805970 RepID=A0ABV6B0Z1_9DEIO